MGPERLDRAKTVEAIAADTAPGRPPWAGAVLVRYPPRGVGLTADAAVGLLGASVDGHGGLIFPTVDAVGGRSLGARRRNHLRVASIGIVPGSAWTDLQRCLPRAGRIQLVERGADPATGKQPRHGSSYRGRDPVLAASGCGPGHPPPPPPGDVAEPARRPSASPHDRRSCNRRETAPRLPRSLSRSPPSSNGSIEGSRRGGESRSLALFPAARKGPFSFSRRRVRIWRRLRACWVMSTLVGRPRIDARVCRCSGFNLRDVFPTGCVAGRAEGAARSPGRGLHRGAELDRSRPQPVVDGVECLDQLVVPWILRIE